MSLATRLLVLIFAWLFPLAWTIWWGVFRGAYAHGGFVWWADVHHGGLVLLGLAAFGLHRRYGAPLRSQELGAVGVVSAGALLTVTWLAFQGGLAVHEPPASVSELLFDEP